MSLTAAPASPASDAGAPILVLEKLDKRFGATHALKAVDLARSIGEHEAAQRLLEHTQWISEQPGHWPGPSQDRDA